MRVLSLLQHSHSIPLLFQLLQPSLAMQRVICPLGLAGGDAALLGPCLMHPMAVGIPQLPSLIGQPWKDAAHPCMEPIGRRDQGFGTMWVMLHGFGQRLWKWGRLCWGGGCVLPAQPLGSMGTTEMGNPWDEVGVPDSAAAPAPVSRGGP